jgi:hypothetical protein
MQKDFVDEKLIRVVLSEEVEMEICTLGITSTLKLSPANIDMLKEYTTCELNERFGLLEASSQLSSKWVHAIWMFVFYYRDVQKVFLFVESTKKRDYELKLSKNDCGTVKDLYDSHGFFVIRTKRDNRERIRQALAAKRNALVAEDLAELNSKKMGKFSLKKAEKINRKRAQTILVNSNLKILILVLSLAFY